MMPQSARILTTTCPKPAVLLKTVKESMEDSLVPLLHKDPGKKAVVVSTLLYGIETGVLYRQQIRLLERFHQRCLRSIPGIKWQDHVSNEEILKRASLASIESIFASSAAALGWPCHEDARPTHAESSLLQRAPRRKARSWCSKKALQRSAEETACTGGNRPSVMAAGLRPRQLALISEKCQL